MAVATVDGLAKGAVRVGRTVHMGEFDTGVEELLVFQQRLGRFLNFVVLAEIAPGTRRLRKEDLDQICLDLHGESNTGLEGLAVDPEWPDTHFSVE